MWRRSALLLATLVGGFGIAAPAAAAPPPAAAPAHAAAAGDAAAATQDTADPVASCRATVSLTAQWPGGLYGQVTVVNTGGVAIHWQVTLSFPGLQIIPPPGYIVIQNGASWLIYPPVSSWNGILPVGASTAFGFTGTVTGTLGQPSATCTATPA